MCVYNRFIDFQRLLGSAGITLDSAVAIVDAIATRTKLNQPAIFAPFISSSSPRNGSAILDHSSFPSRDFLRRAPTFCAVRRKIAIIVEDSLPPISLHVVPRDTDFLHDAAGPRRRNCFYTMKHTDMGRTGTRPPTYTVVYVWVGGTRGMCGIEPDPPPGVVRWSPGSS